MDEIQPLIDLLPARVQQVLIVMGALRVAAKPFSAWVQVTFSKAIAHVVDSRDQADELLLSRVLASRTYRAFNFTLDMITSAKLPTLRSLNDELEKRRG